MNTKTTARNIILALALAPMAGPVLAATEIPASADVSRIHEDRTSPSAPGLDALKEPLAGKVDIEMPAGAEKIMITVNSIRIKGATVYSTEELKTYYSSLLGKKVSLDKVYGVAKNITQTYRNDGYVLTRAVLPPQDVTDGNITIQVVEGYVAEVIKSGDFKDTAIVSDILEPIAGPRPLNIYKMEKALLLLNDLPGVEATAVLKPATKAAAPGAVNAEILLQRRKPQGSVYANNSGSKYLGPYQGGATLKFGHDLLLPYQETSIGGLLTSDLDELKYVFVRNAIALNPEGTKLSVRANYTRTNPGDSLEALEVKGTSYGWGLTLEHPFIRSRQENLSASLTFDYDHAETSLSSLDLFDDNSRALRFSVEYSRTDSLGGSNLVHAELSKGLGIFGASEKGDLNLSRAEGNPDFVKFSLEAERLQHVYDLVNLYVATQMQVANAPLLSLEEFGYGGRRTGRAYDASEITGDNGVSALVEMYYDRLPFLSDLNIQPYAFFDIGKVWNKDTGGETLSGSSAGAGFRLRHPVTGFSADLSAAAPIMKPSKTQNSDPRFFFSVSYNF
jgi:hemolysin activation/secretion protein